jgi:hypothetical protein
MRRITLTVKDSYYTLLVQFLRSLTYVEIQKEEIPTVSSIEPQSDERQKMIDYIMSYRNDKPSFGDAAEWQNHERADSPLPFNQ